MSTVRSLANLHCATCADQTLHSYGRCVKCDTPNNESGAPPVPRPASAHAFNTMKGEHYNASLQAQGEARRRARAARHQIQRGVSKC